jgi:hypothetical protein
LDHDSNRPADGFHHLLFWRPSGLCESFLVAVAAFFLTVAIAPASVLDDPLAVSRSLSDEIFREPVHVICFDLSEALSSGITMDTLSREPEATQVVSLEAQGAYGADGSGSAMLSALAGLPENRGVWLFAVSPWIWTVIAWHLPPRWRRRIRRNRYVD